MTFKNVFAPFCIILLTLILSDAAYWQSTVSISGKVAVELEENYLRAVEGALVEVHRLDRKDYKSSKTDSGGIYSIIIPAQGSYLILVSGPGIEPLWANSTTIRQNTTIDFCGERTL